MSAQILLWIPLAPLLASALLAAWQFSGRGQGEAWERSAAWLVVLAITVAWVGAAWQAWQIWQGKASAAIYAYGVWFDSGRWQLQWQLQADGWHLALAALLAGLLLIGTRFAIHYLHRETGFQRVFALLALLTGAMMLIVLAANVWLTFVGWELAGVSSYALIAYAYDRPVAAAHASRVLITNRLGDAGLLLLLVWSLVWLDSCEWGVLNQQVFPSHDT